MPDWLPERLPEDVEAERSLLATCCAPGMEFRAADIAARLTEEDFVAPQHKALFQALRELIQHQVEVNALTLKDILDQRGQLGSVGGFAGLTELLAAEEVGRPEVLADLLRRKTTLRRLVKLGARVVREAADEEKSPKVLVDEAAQELFHLSQEDGKARGLLDIESVAKETVERLETRLRTGNAMGVPTGLPTLDTLTQGFQPGNLVVLAARPGVGKTALALNWLLRAAGAPYNRCGAFFSLEMSQEEVFLRLLSAHSRKNLKHIQAGRFDDHDMAEVLRARDHLIQLPLYICDQAAITVPQIQNMVTKQGTTANRKIDFLIVDYLQLLSSPQGSRAAQQNEAVRVGEISRGLKLLAKENGIPVIVLSQLNRDVEHRQGGPPRLSDLRDSGAIEQDADIVAFIHRRKPEGGDGSAMDNDVKLIVAKHRNGPTRDIPLTFQSDTVSFFELALETNPGYE
ncbi:MAG TPA: replicative DNA helicase [Holophagaceae bacterium]|nr:replicative DNA helicase [Holophagaceae bacterium]